LPSRGIREVGGRMRSSDGLLVVNQVVIDRVGESHSTLSKCMIVDEWDESGSSVYLFMIHYSYKDMRSTMACLFSSLLPFLPFFARLD
jgi:hypothetical protein